MIVHSSIDSDGVYSEVVEYSPVVIIIDLWILSTGFWNDNKIWIDEKFWID